MVDYYEDIKDYVRPKNSAAHSEVYANNLLYYNRVASNDVIAEFYWQITVQFKFCK